MNLSFFVCLITVFLFVNLSKFIYIYHLFLRVGVKYVFCSKDTAELNQLNGVANNNENISVLLKSLRNNDLCDIPMKKLDEILYEIEEVRKSFIDANDFLVEESALRSLINDFDNNYIAIMCTLALFAAIYFAKVYYFGDLVIYKVEHYQGLDVCYFRQGGRTLFVEIIDSKGNVEIEWLTW